MRKKLLLAAVLIVGAILFLASVSQATPPSKVEPVYDAATKTLSVHIRHWSLADGLHHVKYVEVKVGDAVVLNTRYNSQPDTEYTYTYTVEALPGDQIEVTAKCNLWGSRKASLTVSGTPEPAGAAPTANP